MEDSADKGGDQVLSQGRSMVVKASFVLLGFFFLEVPFMMMCILSLDMKLLSSNVHLSCCQVVGVGMNLRPLSKSESWFCVTGSAERRNVDFLLMGVGFGLLFIMRRLVGCTVSL